MSNIISIILILASAGLFFGYIDPTYTGIKTLLAEKAEYDGALTRSKELQIERDKLLTKFNAMPKADRDMLAKLVKALAGVLADELTLRQIVVGEASQTWDAANMANATGTTSPTFTVAGAAFGDYVDVSASITLAGVVAVGYVSASNTVVIRLHNGTGGAVNLASATWKVSVRRPVVRTLAQAKAAVATKISNGESD